MNMSICIIGCGSVGSVMAEQLSKRDSVDQIKLLDVKPERPKQVKEVLEDNYEEKTYKTGRVDASKKKSVKNKLKDINVVINSASPICNIPIMEACLASNTNYIDLASDPFEYEETKGTTFDKQLELQEKFSGADLLAVTNTGFSPGFTDILSKYIIKKESLEHIDYIKVYLGEKILSEKFVMSWSPYIFLMESLLPPTVYKENKITSPKEDRTKKSFNFSSPIDKINLRIFNGHPELRTIPKYIKKPIDHIEIAGGYKLNEKSFNEIIIQALQKQIKNSRNIEGDIFQILSKSFEDVSKFRNFFEKDYIENEFSEFVFKIKGKNNEGLLKKEIRIDHNLEEVSKDFSLGTVSSFMVSFVPVIIAEMISDGNIEERGVMATGGLSNCEEIVMRCQEAGLLEKSDL